MVITNLKATRMKVIVLLLSFIWGMGFSQVIDTSYLTKYESDNNFYFLKKSIYETEGQKFKSDVFKMDNNLELLLISTIIIVIVIIITSK